MSLVEFSSNYSRLGYSNGDVKTCSKCKDELPESSFTSASHTRCGLYSWCRSCAVTYQKKVYLTLGGQLKHRVRAARKRASDFGLAFDLDTEYLMSLWESQNGCCAISGLPMILDDGSSGKQPFRPSVDRIEPSLGYVKGNVRLVSTLVNFALNKWGFENFLRMCKAVAERQE